MNTALALLSWPLKGLSDLVSGAGRWLVSDFRHIAIAALALLAAITWLRLDAAAEDRNEWQSRSAIWEAAAGEWKAAHEAMFASLQISRKAAAEADRENAARVGREMEQLKKRTADDYEIRLADTGAALERLRHELARSGSAPDGGSGGAATPLPTALTARCRAFGAANCDALLAALPDQLAAAEDNTAKLIALQDWARGTLAIDFSGTAPATAER